MKRRILLGLIVVVQAAAPVVAAPPTAPQAQGSCSRECLLAAVASFKTDVLAKRPMALAPNAEVRENMSVTTLAASAWKEVRAVKSSLAFADAASGNVVSRDGVELSDGRAGYISTRLKIAGGQITEVELSSDLGRVDQAYVWGLPATLDRVLPPGQRSSREALDALGRRYFQSLTDHKAIRDDFDDARCNRFHSGNQITNVRSNAVEGPGARTCITSIDGPKAWGPADEQRFPVIDVERGVILGTTLLMLADQQVMFVSEIFKVEGGRIVHIDNIGIVKPGLDHTTGFGARKTAADLVLLDATVHTVDPKRPRAEAVAIRGNRIVAVGTSASVRGLVGPQTKVLDLRGRTVVPGFDDAHAHMLGIGFARLDVDLVGTRSYAEVAERVAAAVKTRKPGEWVRGRGWHEGKWDAPPPGAVRGFPTHQALTAVSPDNPVVLTRADGHAALANARAMAAKGVSRQTLAPEGGEVIRDAAGEPTGVFVDNAEGLVEPPARTPEESRRALDLAMDECLAKGVTSLTDAGATTDVIALYKSLAAEGKLRTRLYVMAAGLPTMRALGRPESGLGGGMLDVRAVKLYADGALGSRGAALLEPYDDDPGNRGLLVTPPEGILEAARFALAHGFQVGTHAIGDRANRLTLDAYAKAFAERPEVKDPRFRIEHAQILDEAEIPRFGKLGVIASMQGIHCPSDRPWAPKRIGDARVAEGAYVWRKLLDTGARIVNGTDAPVEDLSAIQNFHASVTRAAADGNPPGGFDPGQKLNRIEALRTMTLDAAYGGFAEREKGSIEVGKLADLVVLSQDVLAVPDASLMKTTVLATIVDGRVLFSRPPVEVR